MAANARAILCHSALKCTISPKQRFLPGSRLLLKHYPGHSMPQLSGWVLLKYTTGHCMPQLSGRVLLKCIPGHYMPHLPGRLLLKHCCSMPQMSITQMQPQAKLCFVCQAGSYSNATQATVCHNCEASSGLYSNTSHAKVCLNCSARLY